MKSFIFVLSISLALPSLCQSVSVKPYRQLLAEDNAGVMGRKSGVVDNRQMAIQDCGYWSVGLYIVNHVGFPCAGTGIKGVRIGILSSENHSVYGVDVAGLLGIVRYGGCGVQISSLCNYVGDEMRGLQLACVNYADSLSGLQLGAINVITHGIGCQIGLLNFANALNGIQIGLLNFNESAVCVCLPIANVSF